MSASGGLRWSEVMAAEAPPHVDFCVCDHCCITELGFLVASTERQVDAARAWHEAKAGVQRRSRFA